LATGASAAEKAALFAGTATRIYRLDLPKIANATLVPAE
jgi:hypothetical protein